jgi:hypothetical protein
VDSQITVRTGKGLKKIRKGTISIEMTSDINPQGNIKEVINIGHRITRLVTEKITIQPKSIITANTSTGTEIGKATVGTITVGGIIMDIINHIHIATISIIIITITMDT